jgi:hypothetical protein
MTEEEKEEKEAKRKSCGEILEKYADRDGNCIEALRSAKLRESQSQFVTLGTNVDDKQ